MLIVTGSVTARVGSFDALQRASLEHVHRSRLEPGCISHSVHIDAEDPLRLFFYEQWQDAAALKTHFSAPGTALFLASVRAHAATSEAVSIYDATRIDAAAVARGT